MALVATRYPSLLQPPVAFARHTPGPDAPDGTLTYVRGAFDRGATGLACEVYLTEDGEAVVHDGPVLRLGLRRRPLSSLPSAGLPSSVLRLTQLYDACGTDIHLAATLVDRSAAEVVTSVAREAGGDAEARLWLCSPEWRQAASWRTCSGRARLVEVSRLRSLDEGPERRAARLAAAGIDAIELRDTDWNAGLTTLFHRFGLVALAGATSHRHRLDAVLDVGVDGVSSDQVEALVAAMAMVAAGPHG